jgi:hypothetical protein
MAKKFSTFIYSAANYCAVWRRFAHGEEGN